MDDDEGDETYRTVLDKAEGDYERARLPLPPDVSDPPTMPEDLTIVGDLENRKLHSQFNACAARSHYLQGLEQHKKVGCQRVLKKYLRAGRRQAREQLGKDASVTELVDWAEENNPEVGAWMRRVDFHSDREEAYQDLFQIYTENVSVLSRDWTMRGKDEGGS